MYDQLIEPAKRYAGAIVPGGGESDVTIDMLTIETHSVLSNIK